MRGSFPHAVKPPDAGRVAGCRDGTLKMMFDGYRPSPRVMGMLSAIPERFWNWSRTVTAVGTPAVTKGFSAPPHGQAPFLASHLRHRVLSAWGLSETGQLSLTDPSPSEPCSCLTALFIGDAFFFVSSAVRGFASASDPLALPAEPQLLSLLLLRLWPPLQYRPVFRCASDRFWSRAGAGQEPVSGAGAGGSGLGSGLGWIPEAGPAAPSSPLHWTAASSDVPLVGDRCPEPAYTSSFCVFHWKAKSSAIGACRMIAREQKGLFQVSLLGVALAASAAVLEEPSFIFMLLLPAVNLEGRARPSDIGFLKVSSR